MRPSRYLLYSSMFHNIDEYNKYLDGLNDLIEKALKSKNFEADHKRIEIVVKW